jgi:ferritin
VLKPEIIAKLNDQLNAELHASNLYLQMSAWCEDQGLAGGAAFFYNHVAEELGHRDKIARYLFECDAPVRLGATEAPRSEYATLLEIINAAYEHEQLVTGMINEIAELALDLRDFNTLNFLQWFIAEQREEEVLFRGILDHARLAAFKGDTGEAMWHLNGYLAQLASTAGERA